MSDNIQVKYVPGPIFTPDSQLLPTISCSAESVQQTDQVSDLVTLSQIASSTQEPLIVSLSHMNSSTQQPQVINLRHIISTQQSQVVNLSDIEQSTQALCQDASLSEQTQAVNFSNDATSTEQTHIMNLSNITSSAEQAQVVNSCPVDSSNQLQSRTLVVGHDGVMRMEGNDHQLVHDVSSMIRLPKSLLQMVSEAISSSSGYMHHYFYRCSWST